MADGAEYFPATQVAHAVVPGLPLHFPRLQAVHVERPLALPNVPLLQVLHCESDDKPGCALYFPWVQLVAVQSAADVKPDCVLNFPSAVHPRQVLPDL